MRSRAAPNEGATVQRSLRWAILGTMLLGTMLAVLDSSILNISTVSMLQEFRVGLSTVEWMLTSYNLVFAAFMIGLGGLGDAVGRRRLYVLGQIVFTIGSGLAAVTAAPWQVIAARAPGPRGRCAGAERACVDPRALSRGRTRVGSGDLGGGRRPRRSPGPDRRRGSWRRRGDGAFCSSPTCRWAR